MFHTPMRNFGLTGIGVNVRDLKVVAPSADITLLGAGLDKLTALTWPAKKIGR